MVLLMSDSLDSWRRLRRAAHEALTKRAIQNYQPIQTKEATILLSSLLKKHSANQKQDSRYKRLAASTIMSIVYDYPAIQTDNERIAEVEGIENFNDRLIEALTLGSFFVDIFPWMKYIPARSWLYFDNSL